MSKQAQSSMVTVPAGYDPDFIDDQLKIQDQIKQKLGIFLATDYSDPAHPQAQNDDLRQIGMVWIEFLCGNTADVTIFHQFARVDENIVSLIWQCLDPDPSKWLDIAHKLLTQSYFNANTPREFLSTLKSSSFLNIKNPPLSDTEEMSKINALLIKCDQLTRTALDEIEKCHDNHCLKHIGEALRVHHLLKPPENSDLLSLQKLVNETRVALAELALKYDQLCPGMTPLWYQRFIPVLIARLNRCEHQYDYFLNPYNNASGAKQVTSPDDSCWADVTARSVCAELDWKRQQHLATVGYFPMLPSLLFSSLYNMLLYWRTINDTKLRKLDLAPPDDSHYLLNIRRVGKVREILDSFSECIERVLVSFGILGVAAITPTVKFLKDYEQLLQSILRGYPCAISLKSTMNGNDRIYSVLDIVQYFDMLRQELFSSTNDKGKIAQLKSDLGVTHAAWSTWHMMTISAIYKVAQGSPVFVLVNNMDSGKFSSFFSEQRSSSDDDTKISISPSPLGCLSDRVELFTLPKDWNETCFCFSHDEKNSLVGGCVVEFLEIVVTLDQPVQILLDSKCRTGIFALFQQQMKHMSGTQPAPLMKSWVGAKTQSDDDNELAVSTYLQSAPPPPSAGKWVVTDLSLEPSSFI